MRTIILLSIFVLLAALRSPVSGQTTEAAAVETRAQPPTQSPRLTAKQRQAYAAARERVMEDAEYKAAVQRAVDAQRAADNLFFAKMTKAAGPELQDYIKFLQQSRSSKGSQAP
jgi:ribosomal protein S30